jgi:chaperonin GroEL
MGKELKFGNELRTKIIAGVNNLARATSGTLGPRGSTVMFRKNNQLRTTKDGVTVAKNIFFDDQYEEAGASLTRECAASVADSAGDGTTLSCLLTDAICSEGNKLLVAQHNPVNIRNGINFAVEKIVDEIKRTAKPVKSKTEIAQVATVSANGDESIGDLLAEAMDKVGNDGIITVEQSHNWKTELMVANGYQFDRGYLSPHYVNNEKMECVLENPLVLIYEGDINNVRIILPVFEKCHNEYCGRPLLIMTDNISEDSLATSVINSMKKSFISCCVKNPGFGDRRKEMMQDLAVLTGAQVVSEELGRKLEHFNSEWLGSAKRVVVTKGNTTIIEGAGKDEDIERRVSDIRVLIAGCNDSWDKEKQEERLAKLTGGSAIISVGGQTESEILERMDRVEDAVCSTRSAVQEGVVVGGGVTLLRAAQILNTITIPDELKDGVNIVKKACEEHIKRIVMNAGIDPSYVRLKVMESDNPNWGYNARTEKFEDLMESGIIDPAKVLRCALQNSASVANLILTTDCLIADAPDPKKCEGKCGK